MTLWKRATVIILLKYANIETSWWQLAALTIPNRRKTPPFSSRKKFCVKLFLPYWAEPLHAQRSYDICTLASFRPCTFDSPVIRPLANTSVVLACAAVSTKDIPSAYAQSRATGTACRSILLRIERRDASLSPAAALATLVGLEMNT